MTVRLSQERLKTTFDIEVDRLLGADPDFVDPWLSALASADELWHSESFMS